jgi:hypothetical protein
VYTSFCEKQARKEKKIEELKILGEMMICNYLSKQKELQVKLFKSKYIVIYVLEV